MGELDTDIPSSTAGTDVTAAREAPSVTRRGLVKTGLILAAGATFPVMAMARQGTPPAASPVASPAASPAASPVTGGGVVIDIVNFAFDPPALTVSAGTIVTWVNVSDTIHNVVAEDETWQSEVLDPGGSYSFQVMEPGTYPYLCTIHPDMGAVLTVE